MSLYKSSHGCHNACIHVCNELVPEVTENVLGCMEGRSMVHTHHPLMLAVGPPSPIVSRTTSVWRHKPYCRRRHSTHLTFTDGWTPLCSNCSSTHNRSKTGDRSEGTTQSHHLREEETEQTQAHITGEYIAFASSRHHAAQHLNSAHNTHTFTW